MSNVVSLADLEDLRAEMLDKIEDLRRDLEDLQDRLAD